MQSSLKTLVKAALKEDSPKGDITTTPLKLDHRKGTAHLVAKQNLVLSGSEPFEAAFKNVSKKCDVKWLYKNGQSISKGKTIAHIYGPLDALLLAERVALNFLGPLSGVATLTREFTKRIGKSHTRIIDTRKTRPLFRELEKSAVIHGGGANHRLSLSDQVLIKENHIRAAGGILEAISKIRASNPKTFLEIEVTNLEEVGEVLTAAAKHKVHRIMLDNMDLQTMRLALKKIRAFSKVIEIEVSGNMTLERVKEVARLGVDFISVGMITHSAPCADISLLIEEDDRR